MKAELDKGPMTIAVAAGNDIFRFYKTGIISSLQCNVNAVDHAIGVIGYGTDETLKLDYWILRNSWGNLWGSEGGYVRIMIDYEGPTGPT
jgi:C1A family cysteine protease